MKKIILGIILIVGAGFIYLFFTRSTHQITNSPQTTSTSTPTEKDSPTIVSTKPDPLEGAFIGANDEVDITFNRSLENVGEFKLRLETKKDVKVLLSSDRKTARIIPVTPPVTNVETAPIQNNIAGVNRILPFHKVVM